jgi:tetratricopeptide (TPR) repeat protein
MILGSIYQWLGVVYGELSMEVIEGTQRRTYQNEAIEMLQKATELNAYDATLFYQLSLQLGEVGEFSQAIDNINQSIKLQPQNPASYNLLALLLSSRGKSEKALEVVIEGWGLCLSKYADVRHQSNLDDTSEVEQKINWETVDPFFKREMIK